MPVQNESAGFRRGAARLDDLFDVALRAHSLGLRVCLPATVVTYDPVTQKAFVLLGHLSTRVTDTGESVDKPLQISVPVAWPRTKFGYITLPLLPGDTGHITVSDRSLEVWLATGAPSDPGLRSTHKVIDGIFTPGLHPDTNPITPPTDMTALVLEGALIKAGSSASEAAVLGNAFTVLYNTMVAIFNAHTHVTTATISVGALGVIAPPSSQLDPMLPGTHTSIKNLVE